MPDIVIVGGGVAGLALARLLRRRGRTVAVVERDSDAKGQGFSLTMQPVGRATLEACGVWDEIVAASAPVAQQTFLDGQGRQLHCQPDSRVTIARPALKRIVADPDVPVVHATVESVVGAGRGAAIQLSTGRTLTARLVCCCDGVSSRIRRQYLAAPNHDLRLCNVYGLAPTHLVGSEQEVQVLDGRLRFFAKPYDCDRHMWELTWPTDPEFDEVYRRVRNPATRPAAVMRALGRCLEAAAGWEGRAGELVRGVVGSTDPGDVIVHPLHDRDPYEELDWRAMPPRILLLGDAAHPMSPYVGQGANHALADALDVAQHIDELLDDDAASARYHARMAARASPAVMRSRGTTLFYHSEQCADLDTLRRFKHWDTAR